MGFVVLHMEKAHGSDSGTTAHIERFIIPKNADPTRTHLNRKLVAYPDGIKDRSAAIRRRLEEAGLTRKIGNNQVRAIRIICPGRVYRNEAISYRAHAFFHHCLHNLSVLLPLVQLGTLPVCEELFFVRVWTCLAVWNGAESAFRDGGYNLWN